jgi:AcrR family transcriptional regulator
MMVRRGDDLREHMLFIAKDVFLESGFERASMDVIAARADTTKRTLYAHFENKEKLFLAVIELVRGLLLGRLKMPADCSEDTAEALVLYCGRFLETLVWDRSIRMCRLSIAESERFPDGAAQLYQAMFGTAQERLEAFLRERLKLSRKAATQAASELLGRVLHPRFTRALFGLDVVTDKWLDDDHLSAELDLEPIRRAVAELVLKARK